MTASADITASADGRRPGIDRGYHKMMLGVSVVVIALSFLLQVRPDGRVFVKGAPGLVLPETCASQILFQADCAGCGLTRSFIYLAAGRFSDSWHMHRAGWLLALVVVAQVPYRWLRLRGLLREARWGRAVGLVLIVCLFAHWLLSLAGF